MIYIKCRVFFLKISRIFPTTNAFIPFLLLVRKFHCLQVVPIGLQDLVYEEKHENHSFPTGSSPMTMSHVFPKAFIQINT